MSVCLCLPSKIFLVLPLAMLCLKASLVFRLPGKFIQWEELAENWRDAIEKMLWSLYPFLSSLWVSVSTHVAITLAALPLMAQCLQSTLIKAVFPAKYLGFSHWHFRLRGSSDFLLCQSLTASLSICFVIYLWPLQLFPCINFLWFERYRWFLFP